MTLAEIVNLAIAAGSLLLAFLAWRSSQRTSKEQLALQKTTARLAERQLEQIEDIQLQNKSKRAALRLAVEPYRKNSHRFVLRNVGNASAKNVSFELRPHGYGDNPLVKDDYNAKFPAPIMQPGSEIGTLAAFSFESARAFDVFLVWENEDGELVEEVTFVTL
jgi:type II secretory pathway pseudopilin PulG